MKAGKESLWKQGWKLSPGSRELSPRPVPTGNLRNDNGNTSKGRDFKIDATGEIGGLAARGRPVAGAIRLQPSSVPGGVQDPKLNTDPARECSNGDR